MCAFRMYKVAHVANDGGQALFRLVRFWTRRGPEGGPSATIQVVTAVHAASAAAGEGATIGAVAHQLGIDHSGASRLVRDAVDAGYLTRVTAGADRRRAALALTKAGRGVLDGALAWQRTAFADLVAGWEPADRDRFATYLERLANEVGA